MYLQISDIAGLEGSTWKGPFPGLCKGRQGSLAMVGSQSKEISVIITKNRIWDLQNRK
jgi:hypothetical protein